MYIYNILWRRLDLIDFQFFSVFSREIGDRWAYQFVPRSLFLLFFNKLMEENWKIDRNYFTAFWIPLWNTTSISTLHCLTFNFFQAETRYYSWHASGISPGILIFGRVEYNLLSFHFSLVFCVSFIKWNLSFQMSLSTREQNRWIKIKFNENI